MEDQHLKTDDTFKVPLLVGKASDGKFPKTKSEKATPVNTSKTETPNSNPSSAVLPYTEPSWSGTPPENYMFQIIKSGVIISNFQIQKSCIVIGRLTTCDIKLEHPSVSRYHAVLQYCAGNDKYRKGFYIYDLGSTHGTFLNKTQIQGNTYYLVKVDNILKFGGSTRLHILLGPEEEEKIENVPKVMEEKSTEEESCSWGIGEDAEEDDLAVNPFSISTENESFYIDDPKKTLRGWFEREGYELEYNVEEKGFRTFVCSMRLPIDTPTGDYLTVEAAVNGKKKEAVVACALEACRTLDRHGVLRQSHHESRERKQKKWEDEDFYDSDEDTYLDRTGTIEKKRQFRMMTVKKPEPETFNSLEIKLKDLNDKISLLEEKLQSGSSLSPLETNQNDDPLDSYLCEMKKQPIDKVTKSKLKLELAELLKERSRLERLLNIAKPAKMPPCKFPNMVGKRIKSKLKLPVSRTIPKTVLEKSDDESEIEDEEEMDQDVQTAEKKLAVQEVSTSKGSSAEKVTVVEGVSHRIQPSDPPKEEEEKQMNVSISRTDPTKASISKPNLPESNPVKHPLSSSSSTLPSGSTVKKARSKKGKDVYNTDENYSVWMPPVNQSGDGTTHLNSKYGY